MIGNDNGAALLGALDVLAELVATKIVAQLRAGDVPDMLDQSASPLGRRRHIAAVRRLVGEGASGAAQVGRRYLLSKELVSAELGRVKPKAPDNLSDLRALLGRAA